MTLTAFIGALLNSLDLGMLLFVIAGGLSIIFGVLGILNFAHGAIYMVGAYLAFTATQLWGLSFWQALVIVPLLVAVGAALIERGVLRWVYGRHVTYQLLLTFALLLVINDAVQLIWGSAYQVVDPPQALAGTVELFGNRYPRYNLALIAAGPLVGLLLWLLFTRTRLGKQVRAAALDRETAAALGIDVGRLFTLVFAFGSWLAGLGGVLVAPVRAIGPGMGDAIIIESFIVVVIGGLGSFPGALLGALILGAMHGFGGRFLPGTEMFLPFAAMVAVLLLRPQGLFGRAVR
ncbi:MAG: branched-chain amino acid ABC transporter permease [Candidatus Competibacterales bacterium]